MNKDKRRGIIGTTVVHLILLVCLFFFALRTPLPLPGEAGVEVSLGFDETGFGDIQSETPPPIQEEIATPPKRVIYDTPEDEEFVKQNTEEAPAIEEKEVVKEPEKKPDEEKVIEEQVEDIVPEPVEEKELEKPVEEPKPVVNTKALYPGTSPTGKNTHSQGVKTGIGDMGKPIGDKESDQYEGQGGAGNGISYSLGGRGAKYLDKPTASFNEVGTVVVTIWVNREGTVVRAQVSPKGTTIVDPSMKKIAVDAAKNSTFAADPNAAELQTGTITYKFVLLK